MAPLVSFVSSSASRPRFASTTPRAIAFESRSTSTDAERLAVPSVAYAAPSSAMIRADDAFGDFVTVAATRSARTPIPASAPSRRPFHSNGFASVIANSPPTARIASSLLRHTIRSPVAVTTSGVCVSEPSERKSSGRIEALAASTPFARLDPSAAASASNLNFSRRASSSTMIFDALDAAPTFARALVTRRSANSPRSATRSGRTPGATSGT